MAIVALTLIIVLSVQMTLVLPPLHYSPGFNAGGFAPVFSGAQDLTLLRRRIEDIENVILSLQISTSRDLRSHEERLQLVEHAKGISNPSKGFLDGGVLGGGLQGRIQALEDAMRALIVPTAAHCPSDLSSFGSEQTMLEAGWKLDVGNTRFYGHKFVGWMDGMKVGIVALKVNVSGQLTLRISNPHQAPESVNEVLVAVNNEVVLKIKRNEDQSICLRLDAGDVMKISETYGQIGIESVSMKCHGQDSPKQKLPGPNDQKCKRGQQVMVPGRICGTQSVRGEVYRILNESRAITRSLQHGDLLPDSMGNAPASDPDSSPSEYSIFSASDLQLISDFADVGHCSSFEFKSHKVGLVVVADMQYRDMYADQIKTHRCYAAWRGYEYMLLDGQAYPSCQRFTQFFFRKHCIVSEFLSGKPSDYVAAVIDADVVATVLDRGLEEWIDAGGDIHFYERVWCFEIAAGNYLARATPWVRNFLMRWAEFMFLQPAGFSSADNGAIHLHLVQSLELEGAAHCRKLYSELHTQGTSDLNDYFRFVNCTKSLLGPPRLWRTSDGGSIAFWGKLHFFVADGVYLGQLSSDYFGPIFHHGIKQTKVVTEHYFSNLGQCEINAVIAHRTREQYEHTVVHQAKWLTGHLPQWPYLVQFPKGPVTSDCDEKDPYNPCLKKCMSNLSCPLLRNNEEPKPHRACKKCQSLT
jgi:hypothetical protein